MVIITYRVLRLTSPPTGATLLLYLPAYFCAGDSLYAGIAGSALGNMLGDYVKCDRILALPLPFMFL